MGVGAHPADAIMVVMVRKTTKSPDSPAVESADTARLAVSVADDYQAADIWLIDIREVSAFADFMVIMTADSTRQINALVDHLEEEVKRRGKRRLYHREGTADSGWVLLDFSDIVLHVFSKAQREYYALEEVWEKGQVVVRLQ